MFSGVEKTDKLGLIEERVTNHSYGRMTMNNGGPAFPTEWTNTGDQNRTAPNGVVVAPGETVQLHGMSLRDWFAGQAMQGLIADTEYPLDHDGLAKAAYDIAGAMLEARKQSR
jgi:hypothetical protein